MTHEKEWASKSVDGKALSICHQFTKYSQGFKVFLWCNSCAKCSDKNGWRGWSTYDSANKKISRAHTPLSEHGDFEAAKVCNPLKSTAINAMKEQMSAHAHVSIPDLAKIVENITNRGALLTMLG